MTQTDKFILNEGVLFMGFGLALYQHYAPACLAALLTIFLAVEAHSLKAVRKYGFEAALAAMVEIIILELCGIYQTAPAVFPMTIAALISACAWNESSYKALVKPMKWHIFVMLVFLILSFVVKDSVYGRLNTVVLTGMIFLPSSILFAKKEINLRAARAKHSHTKVHIPVVE